MSTQSRRGRPIAMLASLLLATGALFATPITPLGRPLVAEASVTAGDIIFGQAHGNDPTVLTQLHGSTTTNLSTGSTDSDYYPDVSPDGSRIVFSGYRLLCSDSHIYECLDLVVMNSDGSGQRIIATGAALGTSSVSYHNPVWSPDGSKIAYVKHVYNSYYIAMANADGSDEHVLTSGGVEFLPTWSPDGTKIAYESDSGSSGWYGQIYVVNASGTPSSHLVAGSDDGYIDGAPVWSPDGNRLYFESSNSSNPNNAAGIYYYTTSDDWATTGGVSVNYLGGPFMNTGVDKLKISADGSELALPRPVGSCSAIVTVSTSDATVADVTDGICGDVLSAPTFVPADWSIKKFTVLGDSFSAGEGNPPFDSGTDTGSGTCHRSSVAYAYGLNSFPDGLSLDAFVACSGATSADLMGTFKTESSQLDAIDASDNYVILTIGGNDVQFNEFATDCVTSNCDGSDQYNATEDLIQNTLPGNLDDLFTQIDASIGPNTRVLVLGYPYIMPLSSQTGIYCLYMSTGERTAATNVQVDLNGAISSAVARAQTNDEPFEYVDPNTTGGPFDGHQLCSSGSYFNGLVTPPFPTEYSFHPNQDGQDAYRQVVANYLAAHPAAP